MQQNVRIGTLYVRFSNAIHTAPHTHVRTPTHVRLHTYAYSRTPTHVRLLTYAYTCTVRNDDVRTPAQAHYAYAYACMPQAYAIRVLPPTRVCVYTCIL